MGKLIHISDGNYRDFCAGGQHAEGRKFGWNGRKTPFGATFRPVAATIRVVPRNEWKAAIQAGQGNFLSDLAKEAGIQVKDQDGLGYCWAYGSTSCVEYVRAVEGLPYFNLSPESVGGPVNNWRNEGGYAEEALKQLMNAGACVMDYMDAPNSLAPRRWKTGWETNCANHRVTEAWDVGTFDELISCLLARMPVALGLNWWGHLIVATDPIILPSGEVGVKFRNSWGDWGDDGYGTLTESKSGPDGAFACRVVTPSEQ